MSLTSKLNRGVQIIRHLLHPIDLAHQLDLIEAQQRGLRLSQRWTAPRASVPAPKSTNPLEEYFDSITEGPGVWKCRHYFDIYHRHFQKFRGRAPVVVEIGVYSGGSLKMWHSYFGPGCHVHGVDIEPVCQAFEDAVTTIHTGDQKDRAFWRRFKERVPAVDIVIDDGYHHPEHQTVAMEELLPIVRPGGAYVCEDILGSHHEFVATVQGLSAALNEEFPPEPGAELTLRASPFQSAIHSIHYYPYVVVVEVRDIPVSQFVAPKHGTQWQPIRVWSQAPVDEPQRP